MQRLWLWLGLLLGGGTASAQTCDVTVDPFRELMVVSPFVVEDARANAGGPWHFEALVRAMQPEGASDHDVSEFVTAWLDQWATLTSVNGFDVTKRAAVRDTVLCPWRNASTGRSDCTGDLNLRLAPFRLLAIVNRSDLRDLGNCANAGEGRFVFAVLDKPTETHPPEANPLSFTVIFEYGLPTADGKDAKSWAEAWHALSQDSLPCASAVGCEAYRTALESVTAGFAGRGVDPPKPNGNALNQLRTNEIALAGPWELREFHLTGDGTAARLAQSPVKQTPDPSLNGSEALKDWVATNAAAAAAGTHVVPAAMQGAHSLESFGTEFKWQLGNVNEATRFGFSSNTCNGCHREERAKIPVADGFYHVSPNQPAGPARLSGFVKNQDLPRRSGELKELLCATTCTEQPGFLSSTRRRVH